MGGHWIFLIFLIFSKKRWRISEPSTVSPLDPMELTHLYHRSYPNSGVDPQSSEGLKPSIDLVELPRLSVNFKSLRKGPRVVCGCLWLWLFVVVCGCLWCLFLEKDGKGGLGW